MDEVSRDHEAEMGIILGDLSSTIECPFSDLYLQNRIDRQNEVVRFEWDPSKAASNLAKHGVRFEDAVRVFADPLARLIQDRHESGQERWQTTGLVEGIVLLVVAHTIQDDADEGDVIRVISARRATKLERRYYEQG